MTVRTRKKRKVVKWFSYHMAKEIFSGKRKYFFFKMMWKDKRVNSVLVYVGPPICKIVGEFDIKSYYHYMPIFMLWDKVKDKVKETVDEFYNFFDRFYLGSYVEIGATREYAQPLDCCDVGLKSPPSTFLYIKERNCTVFVNYEMRETNLTERQAKNLVKKYKEINPTDNIWYEADHN